MTRDPRKEDVVWIPRVGRTNERHKGGLILHVLTERPPDVLKRPKILVSRIKHLFISITYYTTKVNLDNTIFMMLLSNFTLAFFMLWPHMQWWRKHEKSNGQIGQLHPEDVVVVVVIHDVFQRPKPYFAREYPKPHLFLYAILIYSNTLLVPSHRWHPKRSSPWPWVAEKLQRSSSMSTCGQQQELKAYMQTQAGARS